MDDVVRQAIEAIREGEWDRLRLLLHPYLHWTEGQVTVRGRRNVLERLAGQPGVDPPEDYELRDGQIYRWTVRAR